MIEMIGKDQNKFKLSIDVDFFYSNRFLFCIRTSD
jgi:hypothetical protein